MQPSAAVLCTINMNDNVFFAAELAAEAAAERTVDSLYARAGEQRGAAAGIAVAVIAITGVTAAAIWKSPLGRKVRNRIANAIKAE